MRILFCGQVPKDPNRPDETEDAFAISIETGRLAVSDGASESFDSRTWAHLLVHAFTLDPRLRPEWLSTVVSEYNAQFDISALSWSKQAAFERGNFATLLGVEAIASNSSVELTSVGDSLAVLLAGGEMIDSFPYIDPQQFQQRPELLCTKTALNDFIMEPDFPSSHQKTWRLSELQHTTLLCMTDALGEWALKNVYEGTPQWEALLSITEIAQLEAIVLREREGKRMRTDDVTLIAVALDGAEIVGLPDA